MPVTCPHCSARYVLPQSLLGPGGARVRCPKCREPFAVGPGGLEIIPLPAPAAKGSGEPDRAAKRDATAPPEPRPARMEPDAASERPETEATGVTAEVPAEVPAGNHDEAPADESASEDEPAAGEPAAEEPEVVETPAMVARQVIEDLASHSGAAIAASNAEGHLFREFGEVIAEAFDAYRLRAGSDADPAPFRVALRERWGVDLEPRTPPKRLT